MAYADYNFYYDVYHGTLSEEEFDWLSARADAFLDYYTQNRAREHAELEAVKMACCALTDRYKLIEDAQAFSRKATAANLEAGTGELQSESVGGYSRTFRSSGDSALAALKAAEEARSGLVGIVREYLAHTGLLYRGRCF